MKQIISGAAIFAISAFTMGCKKTDVASAGATGATVTSIKADPTLTVIATLISNAGDDSYVNGSAAIIAPTDSAFAVAGITQSIAATFSPATSDSIIKYYTLPAGFSLNGTANTETPIASTLGPSFFVDSTGTALYFDGAPAVSTTPIIAGSSSIYKVSQFIPIPAAGIAQIINSDNSLTLFNEALNRTNLAASLAIGSFTLLMPTNTAFANAGYPDIASIDAADLPTLTNILMYHAIPNWYFDNDLALQTTLTTFQGSTLQLSNTGSGLMISGNSNPSSPATLLSNGQLAGNLLAYKISSILLP